MPDPVSNSAELRQAFVEHDRRAIINNVQVGCLLGVVLMPFGVILDFWVYRDEVTFFLGLRLLCSLLIGLFWLIVVSPLGRAHPRKLGVTLAMFPSFFISWMIYGQDGSEAPYYAGLNLVRLVVGFLVY